MIESLSKRVEALGLTLPAPSVPIANFVPFVVSQNLLFISGQVPLLEGKPAFIGHVGGELDETEGTQAAELAALGLLSQLGIALGDDLARLVRVVRLSVYVAATAEFTRQSAVANGASNLLVNALGDKGKHARTAIGVASLPSGVAVEVDAIFEVLP